MPTETTTQAMQTTVNQLVNSLSQSEVSTRQSVSGLEQVRNAVSGEIQHLAQSSEDLSGSFRMMASSVDEMSVSLNDVATSAVQAANNSEKAMQCSRETTQTVQALGNAIQEIGKMLEFIKEIAAQTNLLALNATIEAANAGDSGKGFAVVANEVKELAKQSTKGAETISAQISTMQGSMQRCTQAINEVESVISLINDYNRSIAAAVEQQRVASGDISNNMGRAQHIVSDLGKGIEKTDKALTNLEQTYTQVSQLPGALQECINTLKTMPLND
jgi:methyl-accepting chemotaxis protein